MMITFTIPAYAAVDSPFDLAQAWEISGTGMAEENTETPESGADSPADTASQSDEPADSPDEQSNDPADEPEVERNALEDTSGTLGMSGELSDAEILAIMEQRLNNLRLAGSNPMLRATTGSVTHTTISINSYNVTVPGVGSAYGSIMYRMKINGQDAFCTQIWKMVSSGTYTAGEATEGNSATARYIANFMASSKTNADYVAAQVLVWESLYGDIGLYSQIIAGTSYQSNYTALKNGTATGSGLLFWISGDAGQEIVTPAETNVPETPETPEEPGDDIPPTETVTTTSTSSEIRTDTIYEYSDAIGQITIAKRDHEARSLDGAIFNIHIQFANGETGGDSAFEVYNGSRLFTYTHPRGDHEPATITVTEVRAPDGYIGDPTPQTAIVHPTYTRITKVTTTTITITTTTTTTTNIETGEVLAEVTESAETSLDPPMVQEYTDFIEGDRETTLTFVNQPKPCSLTIYKYEKGSYGIPLNGAKFRIRYADPNVSAQVWTLATDSTGTIVIDLPAAGTLIIEELEAPAGYVIGSVSMWEVVVAKGEHKVVDISNDKKADIIVYKKDAQTGQLLAGATIKATLLRSHTTPYESGMVYTVTTGADGKAVFGGMIPGEYRIEEQSPPQYYLGTDVVHTVSVYDGSNEPVTVTFENEPWTGLTIKKVDAAYGHGLQGAVFKLYGGTAAETTKFLGDFVTNENGIVIVQNLESNKYYTIVEAQPPFGYFIDEENPSQTVLIKPEAIEGNLNVVFRNMPKPKLLITKIDEATGIRLPGAVFRVAGRGSAEYVEVTTGADGTVLLENLEETWYQVTEIRSPSGYLLDSTVHDIELIAGETAKLVVNNSKQPTLVIEKIDEKTGLPLSGAVFRVAPRDGGDYVEVTTDTYGTAVVNGLTDTWYTVTEVRSPTGYVLDDTPKTVELLPGKTTTVKISNDKKPSLTIKKIDEQTGEGLSGVVLRVTKSGAMEYQDVTTGADGTAVIKDMEPGWVTVVEQKAKDGYILDQTPHHIQLNPGEDAKITVTNRHKPSLLIVKLDSVTKQPLQYVTFSVAYKNGKTIGEFTTDENGEIYLENVDPGLVVITETKGRDGYIIADKEKEALVEWGKLTTVEFLNTPKNPIIIKKIDAKTGEPLPGAVFTVTKVNGEYVGEYKTGRNGFITVTGVEPGFFTVRETKSPLGYILNDTPKTVELKLNQPAEVTFENKPLNGIQISKIDAQTREPLEGVKFVVREKGGRTIGEFTTNSNGLIDVPDLEPGWFQVYESASLPGYLLDSNVRDVELVWNDHVLLEFTNTKLSGLQVRKLDAVTGEPLQGVKFRVTKMNGEYVGDYVTGAGGYFAVSDLEPDWYTAYETATIAGYVLDSTPQNIQIKKGTLAVLEFTNRPLSGLQIKKVDAVTREPLAGVEFKVTELDGRLVGSYTTDEVGLVFVPNLDAGWYVVTEVKGLTGYKPDTVPRNVEVKTGELNVVEYQNQPYPVFVLKKIDVDTLQPLEGVRFRLMDRYHREIGIFTTNSLGQIILTGMDEGTYYCQEVEAKAGYQLDATVREVLLQWGKTTTIEVKNTPMATLRIRKVDSETGKPIPGVTFLLYDWKNNLLGEYTTDNNGVIELPREIAAGKYKLKETKTDPNYVLDDQVRTIEVKSGETTEVVIENQPKRGQIQIVKKSDADNPITKDKAGAVLEGAVFDVYDKDLNVVDTITTDSRGIATTEALPLGTYGIKEVEAPEYYFTDGKVFYAEVKLHGDVVRFEVLNSPMDISVTVEKRGNVEVVAGDEMRYDFSNIANTGNVSLDEFYWHDQLPTDAVRLKTIHTGTWSESLTYKVTYKTNLKSGYKTLAANLSSKTSHTLDCSPSVLKLASDEYITNIRFEFGTVGAGFKEDTAPVFVVTTLATLPDGYRIVNNTDVGGRTGDKSVAAKDIWITIALGKPRGDLPKTGF